MITALDTNILLDVLIPDESHFQKSKKLLDDHFEKGQLVISEVVYAELASQFPTTTLCHYRRFSAGGL
jgi:predicted nucleic acid-binding protein